MLEAALIGFEQMKRNVEEKIAGIRRELGAPSGVMGIAAGQVRRRTLSAEARRRIAEAQRKRWAAVKAQGKAAAAKRTMSPAARRKIAAAQRQRWAKVRQQQNKAGSKAAAKKPAPVAKEAPAVLKAGA